MKEREAWSWLGEIRPAGWRKNEDGRQRSHRNQDTTTAQYLKKIESPSSGEVATVRSMMTIPVIEVEKFHSKVCRF
ncbi:hypothetical protein IEQ34_027048 [Dendrobium chrysotoxum]|uniref:Uncharacterized protein n=1 Tax=Dendrobium chrysotoxum TaxID=161865 RepID=A0AAV7FGG3_DENCH|nr:hypothetical protein IEQ34_027048 [Dendrobium chrysotoxum]